MEKFLTVLTALAGIASAIAVIFQAVIFRRQSSLMRTQVELQRQTTQAYNIAIWMDEMDCTDKVSPIISNNSQSPIYEVEIIFQLSSGIKDQKFVRIIPREYMLESLNMMKKKLNFISQIRVVSGGCVMVEVS
ncbi:hypothetical protein OfM1_11710 [Lactovum odontotermitis]